MVAVRIYWFQGKGGCKVAQKVSVTYACDYDQKEIPPGQHRVRRFSFDGRDYEIDLCAWHSDSFDDTITLFASMRASRRRGRRWSSAGRPLTASTARASAPGRRPWASG